MSRVNRVIQNISPSGTVKVDTFVLEIVKELADSMKGMPLIAEQKYNPDFLLMVCTILESVFKNSKGDKVDKMVVLMKVLEGIFSALTDPDKRIIKTIVEHLHSNKQIVKVTTGYYKKILKSVGFKKKWLF
jgi:hypothetical protein